MFGNYSGGDFNQHTYSSDQIEGEGYVGNASQKNFNLAWTPVIPGSVILHVETSGDEETFKDDGNGFLKKGSTTKATINYETGEVEFDTAPENGVALEFSYEYNNMEVPVDAPEVVLKLVTSPIQAKSRKLKTLYSFDAA